jgi:hypothetical protein
MSVSRLLRMSAMTSSDSKETLVGKRLFIKSRRLNELIVVDVLDHKHTSQASIDLGAGRGVFFPAFPRNTRNKL